MHSPETGTFDNVVRLCGRVTETVDDFQIIIHENRQDIHHTHAWGSYAGSSGIVADYGDVRKEISVECLRP